VQRNFFTNHSINVPNKSIQSEDQENSPEVKEIKKEKITVNLIATGMLQ